MIVAHLQTLYTYIYMHIYLVRTLPRPKLLNVHSPKLE